MKTAAIDIGLKRIGVALCLQSDIVVPKSAILRKNRNQAANEVDIFLREWEIEVLIVGLAVDGKSADEMQRRVKHFISLLKFEGKVVYIDEDFSSYEAKEKMKGVVKQKKDGKIDSISAVVILERYLMNKNED
ncbi:MAG: Holliday junction resolvase RuvX [Campylobacteraceae bacterium]|nr:Holliday junction resolvase RuvX [Campylobacteraceae bacterium]